MSERIQNPNLRQKKELLVSIPGTGKATVAVIVAELDNLETFQPCLGTGRIYWTRPKRNLIRILSCIQTEEVENNKEGIRRLD